MKLTHTPPLLSYATSGSVYFDTRNFHGDHAHHYAKLRPEAPGDLLALAEGEGALKS